MKIDPINLILNKKFKYDSRVYFISGNEITLMNKVKDLLIESLKKNDLIEVQTVKSLKSIDRDISLFNKRKLYIVTDLIGVDEGIINSFDADSIFLFHCENSPKVNSIKRIFTGQKNSLVIDCYELDKDTKIKIVNDFLLSNNLEIEKELFWNFIDMLDSRYMLLEQELEKIKEVHPESINYNTLIKTISKVDLVDDKIFFKLMDTYEDIINTYNSKVTNQAEANKFYFTIKKFTNLIIDNEEKKDFEKNIPKYLFREKNTLVSIFQRFNFSINKSFTLLINVISFPEMKYTLASYLKFLFNIKFIGSIFINTSFQINPRKTIYKLL